MEFVNPQVTSVPESRRSKIMSLDWWQFEEERSKPPRWSEGMVAALKAHWPEYVMEALELGIFMISACAFSVLLFHPASPISHRINNDLLTRALMGVAMGATAIAIIFSPLGKRSGAHFNPAVTLTYLRLGKVAPWDAAFLHHVSVCRWHCWRARGFAGFGQFGRSRFSKLLGNAAWSEWANAGLPGGANHLFHSHDGGPDSFQHKETRPLDGAVCGCLRRHIYHLRVAYLRHEHEPRTNV